MAVTEERVLLLEGEEMDGRRGNRTPVAFTRCAVRFDEESNLLACVEELRASDEQLRKRPDDELFYNWMSVYRVGERIEFGVAWYDKAFFERRKEAYRSNLHSKVFAKFGATADDFSVEHEVVAS